MIPIIKRLRDDHELPAEWSDERVQGWWIGQNYTGMSTEYLITMSTKDKRPEDFKLNEFELGLLSGCGNNHAFIRKVRLRRIFNKLQDRIVVKDETRPCKTCHATGQQTNAAGSSWICWRCKGSKEVTRKVVYGKGR